MLKQTVALFLFLFFFCSQIYAASIGGPYRTLEPGNFSINIGGNAVSEMDLKSSGEASAVSITSAELEVKSLELKIGYGVVEKLDIYGKLFTKSWDVDTKWSDSSQTDLEYDMGGFGVGLKYVQDLEYDIFVGVDVQYLKETNAKLDIVRENGVRGVITNTSEPEFSEYQISLFVGKKIPLVRDIKFIPYAGLIYDKIEFEHTKLEYNAGFFSYALDPLKFEEDNALGYVIGADILLKKGFLINIEARFNSETATTTGIAFEF